MTTSQNIEVVDAKGIPHLYRPQRSCGKVIFSQASVILFTGGGVCPACIGADTPSPCRHSPRPDTPWEDTPQGRHVPLGRHPPGQTRPGKHPPPYGHCSGRYASYWNAFLYFIEKGSFGGQCTKFVYSAV